MTSWSQLYLRGARRAVCRTTYEILLVGIVLAVLPSMLVFALVRNSSGLALVAAIVGVVIWVWAVRTFVAGALAMAATERPGLARTSAILAATRARLGTFLCVSLILALGQIAVLLGLLILGLVGFGGRATAPVIGLLTPVFLLGGGISLLGSIVVKRLAIAAVAAEPLRANAAIRKARALARRRLASVALWLAAEFALVVGLFVAAVIPLLIGAAWGVGFQALFFFQSVEDTSGSGGVTVGAGFWLVSVIIFLLLVLGGMESFSVGSAGAFYEAEGAAPQPPQAAAAMASPAADVAFCDQCGRAQPAGAPFCDVCGRRFVLA